MPEPLTATQGDVDGDSFPVEWGRARLGDVATLASGGTPSKGRPDFWDGSIPWASPKDLKQPYLFDAEDHISEAGLEDGSRLVQPGTLFLVVRGMILARDIPVSMAMVPMAFNQDMKAIFPGPRVNGRYLLYSLQHYKPSLLHEIGTSAHGTRRISTSAVENFSFPLPPLGEQRAIAGVLDAVRLAKEAAEKTIIAARQLKASLMRHLFTYGPVPVGQAEQVAIKETDFGSVPQSWPTISLERCSEVQTGVAKGRSLNRAEVVSVPYLRVANVQDGYLDLAEIKNIEIKRSELPRFSLQAGDVVLTEGGDFDKLGRGFIWNGEIPGCVHQNHIFAVRANRSLILPEFLAYLTQSPYGKSYFLSVAHKTTNLACINTTKLKAFPALVPTIQDQQDIVDTLTAVDQKIAAEQKKRSALDALFKTLLDQLMTGKIRLTDLGLPVPMEAG